MLTKLDTLHTDLLAVEGKQDTGNISLGSIDTKLTSQATAANQATEITKLTSLDTKLPAQGPALRTGATPVTMASDQPAINVGGTAPTGTAPAANPISVSGIDGGGLKRHLLTDTAGRLEIDTIQSLPLPAGASTLAAQTQLDTDLNAFKAANHTDLLAVQTKQDTGNASFASIDTKLSSQATAANQTTMSTKLDTLHADNLVVEGKQDTGNISLSSIDTKLTSQATAANQVTEITKLTSLDNKTPALVSGRQPVDGSGVVQPISANDIITTGSITAVAQTVVLSTAGQSSGSFQISGTWVGTLLFEGSLDGVIWNAINAVSSSTSSPQPTTSVNGLYRLTPGALQQIRVNAISFTSGTVNVIGRSSLATGGIFANQIIPIIASALPLPAGAATSAAQTTQQSSLSSIDAKLTNGNQSARSLDGAGNAITSTTIGAKQRLDVTLAAGATVGTAVGIYTDIVGGKDIAGNAQMIATDTSGNQTAVGNVAAGTTDSGNPVKVGGKYNATAPTLVDGQRGDIQLTPNSRVIMVAEDGAKSTYSTAIQGLAASTAATDIFTITGSATKTVRIIKVGFSGIQTSGTIQDVLLIKRSAANTGGISSTPTIVPYDSNSAVATAVVRAYTVNPAMLGTAIGTVKAAKVLVNQSSGGPSGPTSPPDVIWVFGQGPTQALVLRGVAQQLVINYNGQTSAGSSLDMFIEWTEE